VWFIKFELFVFVIEAITVAKNKQISVSGCSPKPFFVLLFCSSQPGKLLPSAHAVEREYM